MSHQKTTLLEQKGTPRNIYYQNLPYNSSLRNSSPVVGSGGSNNPEIELLKRCGSGSSLHSSVSGESEK